EVFGKSFGDLSNAVVRKEDGNQVVATSDDPQTLACRQGVKTGRVLHVPVEADGDQEVARPWLQARPSRQRNVQANDLLPPRGSLATVATQGARQEGTHEVERGSAWHERLERAVLESRLDRCRRRPLDETFVPPRAQPALIGADEFA